MEPYRALSVCVCYHSCVNKPGIAIKMICEFDMTLAPVLIVAQLYTQRRHNEWKQNYQSELSSNLIAADMEMQIICLDYDQFHQRRR